MRQAESRPIAPFRVRAGDEKGGGKRVLGNRMEEQ